MDSKSLKRRNLIKNILIIFLLSLLFLTFFSNTIMNLSLPEVSAQYPSSGTITSRIRKSGNVMATEDYDVILDETRYILSVEVKKGDTIAIGDLLFTLEEGDSNELIKKIAEYDEKKIAYEKKLLEMNKDYTDLVKDVNDASSKLTKLKNKKDNTTDNEELIKQLESEIKQLEREIANYTTKITELTGAKYDYSVIGKSNETILDDANKFYNAAILDFEAAKTEFNRAEQNLDTAEKNKNNAQKALDKATTELTNYEKEIGEGSVTEESILSQKRALETMEIEKTRATEELEAANLEWQKAISEAYTALNIANSAYYDALNGDRDAEDFDSNLSKAQLALQEAGINYNNVQSTKPSGVTNAERSIQDIEIKIKNAKEDLARDEQKYNDVQSNNTKLQQLKNAKTTAQNDLDISTDEFNDATKAEETATKNKDDAEALMNGYLLLKLKTEKAILEDEKAILEDEKADLSDGTTVKDTDIEAAEEALKTAQEALTKARNDDNKNSQIEQLELEKLKKELDQLEADVERLQKNNIGTEVRAKVAGKISDINYTAGQKVEANNTLARIQIVDKGYYVQFDVTNEEATRIRPGDLATVQYYWASNITATVESILNSESNPGKSKTVRVSIAGEVDVGRNLTFSLGERGQNYDTIVPKSAIREDSNGKFILTVVSKSTPLGNRYTAVRVDVTVLEEDDTNAAINLGLYGSEFVITTSTKPIKDGDQVRLVNR